MAGTLALAGIGLDVLQFTLAGWLSDAAKAVRLAKGADGAITATNDAEQAITAADEAVTAADEAVNAAEDTIDLYHGTNVAEAANIRANGIDLSAGRSNLDFGRGFYTTHDPAQAAKWAESRYHDAGTVLHFRVPASMFNDLSGKVFLDANDEYVNMVRSMRSGGPMHPYDYVEGPILGNSREFLAGKAPVTFGNQISFHTEPAVNRLFGYLLP